MAKTIEKINCRQITSRAQDIKGRALAYRDKLLEAHTTWDREMDARITAFNRLGAILTALQASFFLLGEFLINENKGYSKLPFPPESRDYFMTTYGDFIRTGLLLSIFSTVESSFRSFLRAVDPSACGGGRGDFRPVYDCLLRSKLSIEPNGFMELLDLLRLARNTIHNNGVHLPKKAKDDKIEYKGVTYNFPYGTRIDFVTLGFILSLTDDLVELLCKVVADPAIATIDTPITDLSSEIE